MNRPPPLTPPESDLTDFKSMPLEVVRFAGSDLVAFEEPAAVIAALLLWGASWHERPAGSLSNDERALARKAGYGRAPREWEIIREGALRGWVECSDGRLYHPVVAEKVRDSWLSKLKQRHRTYCSAIRQHNSRHPDEQKEAPSFEDWLESGQPTAVKRGNPPMQQENLPLEHDLSRATNLGVTRNNGECHAQQVPLSRAETPPREEKGKEEKGRDILDTGRPPLTKRGRRLPDGWRPETLKRDTVSGEIADARGQDWMRRAFETFENHWRNATGKGAAKLDWQAAWANWVIEQDRRDGRGSNGHYNHQTLRGTRPDPSLDLLRAAEREIADRSRNEENHRETWLTLPPSGSG